MLATSPLDRARRGRRRTAFERNLLPGFARWFVDQVEQSCPDFLIPVETKGARLLETVLLYAREVLGRPINVPIVYATALAYLDPALLERSRVMILDDTVRTGKSIAWHRERVERCGAKHVEALACVGYATNGSSEPPVSCYRFVEEESYSEYVWQLTELVVARGLPPEVDHNVFELHLPERLPLAWETLKQALGRYGSLCIEAPHAEDQQLVSMTLHFPVLPGTVKHPTEGDIRTEGVTKIRFFPDPATERIYVVPVSFPALQLSQLSDVPVLSPADAQRLVRQWAQSTDSIGELLLDEASRLEPEMILRALSTFTEMDLVCGLARVLTSAFEAGDVRLITQREVFHRLYGKETGERVASQMDAKVRSALSEDHDDDRELTESRDAPLWLDGEVVETTKRIAGVLRTLHAAHTSQPDHDPSRRSGKSMSEIKTALPETDDLLVSRCFDYGLAMTTLVAYIDAREHDDGSIELRRRYRVSEAGDRYEDIDDINERLSEETVALIAHYLRTRSARYAGRAISETLIGQVAAVLRPLALEQFGIPLHLQPSAKDPLLLLSGGAKPTAITNDPPSALFALDSQGLGILPTGRFEDNYEADVLTLDKREYTVELESYLDLLLKLLDDMELSDEDLDSILTSWAMSTDQRLGLTYVRHKLELALNELKMPLNLMLRGESHESSPDVGKRSREHVTAAKEQIEHLRGDWATKARSHWEQPSKRERQVLASLAAPTQTEAFDVPLALADVTSSLSLLTEQLEKASLSLSTETELASATSDAIQTVLAHCAQIERTLTTMRDDECTPPPLPSAPRAAIVVGAEALLRVSRMVRIFAAATVGAFRGDPRPDRNGAETQRQRSVLFADLSGSFEHALEHDVDIDYDWKNSGLNLVAQWGKAFGGKEKRGREGDAIWVEFAYPGDPAVLCAAAVQQHARALRSTGILSVRWGLYVAVNHDHMTDGDGRNTIGVCLDRAAKLAKVASEDQEAIERVLVTPEATDLCAPALRESQSMTPFREPVSLADIDDSRAHFQPMGVDPSSVMRNWRERVCALAAEINSQEPAKEQGQVALDLESPTGAGADALMTG